MNIHIAGDLLFRDFIKLMQMGIGYGIGRLGASYAKEKLQIANNSWKNVILYLQAIVICMCIAAMANAGEKPIKPEIIELFVLLVIPALLGAIQVHDREDKTPSKIE